jgi:hypothetical protein
VLAVGGNNLDGVLRSTELYDPATGAWLPVAGPRAARYGHTATLLPNGQVLIAGGENSVDVLGSAELSDPGLSLLNPITNPIKLGDGSFQFLFHGNPGGANYHVLASPDAIVPSNTWSDLGPATETPPGSGQFQFADPEAGNYPRRFYRVSSP